MLRWVNVYSRLASILVCLLAIAACWIIPYRLHSRSDYLFGYCPDEYTYAYRMQPLISGTTSNNPINGIGDSNVVSPFFLENICRGITTVTGLRVESLFWLWRIAFPFVMLASIVLLMRECFDQGRRSWRDCLHRSLSAAAVPLLYCLYDLATPFPPLQGYINRIPTGIEYPLSILLLASFVRLLKRPGTGRATAFVIAAAALVYLRPYIAIPWSFAMGACLIVLAVQRFIESRLVVYMTGLLVVSLTPLLSITYWNNLQAAYVDMTARYFNDMPFTLHPRWPLYAIAGGVFALSSRLLKRPWNVFAICCGATMLLAIFVFNFFKFKMEMLALDRMGAFYLTVPIVLIALALNQRASTLRGKSGLQSVARVSIGYTSLAVVATVLLAVNNARFDFAAQPRSPYDSIADDLKYVPAYRWINEHCPDTALFLVDDGRDWSLIKSPAEIQSQWEKQIQHDDLFSIIARRRRVFHQKLYGNILSGKDYSELEALHHGTFGAPIQFDFKFYLYALNHWQPDYVLWKKSAAIPRAYGGVLSATKEIIYTDNDSEIWKVSYPLKN